MRCTRCGGTFIAGMVGMTMWPAHVCPDGTKDAEAEMTEPPSFEPKPKNT